MFTPIIVLSMQFQYFTLYLCRHSPASFGCPQRLVTFKSRIPFFLEARFPVVKGRPPYMGFLACRCHVMALLPEFKEQFPLLRCRWWKVDPFCFHSSIVLFCPAFA